MIDQARTPLAAHRLIVAAGDEACILDRDHRLIVVAIKRPGLNLPLVALAAVQKAMKRMQPVIARSADLAQLGLELAGGEHFQSAISIPSSATSQPAAVTRARSGEPSIRIGFVLLIWIRTRR